jgi:hypothetical protein
MFSLPPSKKGVGSLAIFDQMAALNQQLISHYYHYLYKLLN